MQKAQLHTLEKIQQSSPQALSQVQALGKDVSQGVFENVTDLLENSVKGAGKLLDILLEPGSSPANTPDPTEIKERQRKKGRKQQQYHGLTR